MQAVKDVRTSQVALIDLFGRMESFFKRLEKYIQFRPTAAMLDIVVKIMVEVISILGIVTKEIRQGNTSMSCLFYVYSEADLHIEKFLKKLSGRNDVEDAFQRLDKLAPEEALMAAVETMVMTSDIDNTVKDVNKRLAGVDGSVGSVIRGALLFFYVLPPESVLTLLLRRCNGDRSSNPARIQSNQRPKP